jgi:predicted phosphohydrolase
MPRQRILWLTDCHLDKVSPWKKQVFRQYLLKERFNGIFLTGDISNGRNTCDDLEMIAQTVSCPIYMVMGNHDYHWLSISQAHHNIKQLCIKYPNLIWLTEAGVIDLNEEVALLGTEGWYDAEEGRPEYLKLTFDWFLIKDFRDLPDMKARIEAWRHLADVSAKQMANALEQAMEQKYKTIYLLTHFPPWKEATRDVGTLLEKFWLPYNTNLRLGRAIEKVMKHHKKRRLVCLAGHTHSPLEIRVSRNIECHVGAGHYLGRPNSDKQIIIL